MNENQDTDPREQRIIDLEIKLSFMEDLLDELNQAVVRHQRHIDLLVREVTALRQQVGDNTPGSFRNLREELPPHY